MCHPPVLSVCCDCSEKLSLAAVSCTVAFPHVDRSWTPLCTSLLQNRHTLIWEWATEDLGCGSNPTCSLALLVHSTALGSLWSAEERLPLHCWALEGLGSSLRHPLPCGMERVHCGKGSLLARPLQDPSNVYPQQAWDDVSSLPAKCSFLRCWGRWREALGQICDSRQAGCVPTESWTVPGGPSWADVGHVHVQSEAQPPPRTPVQAVFRAWPS